MPFKKKSLRKKLEAQLDELATQADDLRQQVVDRAPGVRDQILDRLPDRDEMRDMLPDPKVRGMLPTRSSCSACGMICSSGFPTESPTSCRRRPSRSVRG